MQNFLKKLDGLAGIETKNILAGWLERVAFVFMVLMFVSAPHSIAATQIAWLTGMFVWVIRWLFLKPRPRLVRTPLDIPLWTFFVWSAVTAVFSYDQPTSLNRLRNVALFLILYYVVNMARTKRAGVFLAFAMILSSMVSVVWTPVERIFGRGVEISGLVAESPLASATMRNGDTLLKVNGKKIKTPDDLMAEIQANELSHVTFYRPDYYLTVDVWRKNLLGGGSAFEQLGFTGWKRSRNWRSAGFYGHYTTFAEVMQLIASLTFGLFIAHLGRRRDEETRRREDEETEFGKKQKLSDRLIAPVKISFLPFSFSPLLLFCVAGMAFALLLSVTRGSQLGFLTAATAMVLVAGNRKMLLTLAAAVLPLALVGVFFLQQSRQVGFFDTQDDSTRYRQTVWREGLNLWTANPRHFFLGVGMDAIGKHAKEWHLYDDGRLPMGHFHSTPIQLLVERGLPALLIWLWLLWIYARTLLRNLKFQSSGSETDWKTTGIVLGSFGGLVGFFAGGFVHYNLGDAEVAMVFFMLMGLSGSLYNFKFQTPDSKMETRNHLESGI